MNSTQITDIIITIQAVITLFISLRAFFLYARTRDDMLFSLGLSMGVIALGGFVGLVGDIFLNGTFNTFWFRYLGQTVSYFFILLSTLRGSEHYRLGLRRWHVFATGLLMVLLLLTPVIPTYLSATTQTVLSASRALVCFIIFFRYVSLFFTKESRFSFLMSSAFFWITGGIVIYSLKFTMPDPLLLDYVGDSVRAAGLAILLAAFFFG